MLQWLIHVITNPDANATWDDVGDSVPQYPNPMVAAPYAPVFTACVYSSPALLEGGSESIQTIDGKQTQETGQWLPTGSNGSRNGASGQDDRGQEGEFDAVGCAVADAEAAEDVLARVRRGWESLLSMSDEDARESQR